MVLIVGGYHVREVLFDALATIGFALLHVALSTSIQAALPHTFAATHVPSHVRFAAPVGLGAFFRVQNTLEAPPKSSHPPRTTAFSLARGALAFEILTRLCSFLPVHP